MSDEEQFDYEISDNDDFDLNDDGTRKVEPAESGTEDAGVHKGGTDAAQPDHSETDTSGTDISAGESSEPAKKRHRFGWIIPVVLICVFAFSFYKFLSQYLTYQQAINEYRQVDNMIVEDAGAADTGASTEDWQPAVQSSDTSGAETVQEPDVPWLSIDFAGLRETNSEFTAVISIPALDLRYPVAQAEDNDKYLHTTFEGTNNASGCIFLDCTADNDFSDINTYVFGHNMKNLTMFGSLKRFMQEEGLCDSDPYVYIYQQNRAGETVTEQINGENHERTLDRDETRVLVYRIFAYYTIPVNDDVYDDFEGDDGYDAYVKDAQQHSLYTPEEGVIDWSQRPDLLTLSTCYATGHVNNFIVQGALVGIAHR